MYCYRTAQEVWTCMKTKKYKTEDVKFIRGTEGHNKKAFRRNEIQTSLLELGQKYVEPLVDVKITDVTEMLRRVSELICK